MEKKENRFSIGKKMYLFIGAAVFLATFGMTLVAYFINSSRIDSYFKNLTITSARNFASFIDVDFFKELNEVASSNEYQEIRKYAEETEDEQPVIDYLREKGLWENYELNREMLNRYLRNMDDIKYLYVVSMGGKEALYDMYLMDDDENPVYQTGYLEEREEEFLGVEPSKEVAPTISHGDWGWLCSAFVPVYDNKGNLVCEVGCDVAMDEIMMQRRSNLAYMFLGAILLTVLVLTLAIWLVNRSIVNPLNMITIRMKDFSPAQDRDYEESGVIDLNIESRDEIEDIYQGIRSMQINIVDYLNDIHTIKKDKEKAERDIIDREKQIGEISEEAYRDSLTSVGSKTAYMKKIDEMNARIGDPETEFAIVMVDVNNLKLINDNFGHTSGDIYLKGCCHIICEQYKHSPIFRIGGDEFVVMVIGEDYDLRHERLKELRAAYEESFSDRDREPWQRYSAASGMAEYASDDNTVELVFKRADEAMYVEKQIFKQKHPVDTIL